MRSSAHHFLSAQSSATPSSSSRKPIAIPVLLLEGNEPPQHKHRSGGRLGRWFSQAQLIRSAAKHCSRGEAAAAVSVLTDTLATALIGPEASPHSAAAGGPGSGSEPASSAGTPVHKPPPPLIQDFYPTPPQSPDLVLQTPQLPGSSRFGFTPFEFAPVFPLSPEAFEPVREFAIPVAPKTCPIPARPIELDLTTEHRLPHARGLRLVSSAGILGAFGANRTLRLDSDSIWDRMPYSPVTATSAFPPPAANQAEEDSVEVLLGGGAGESSKKPLRTV